MSLAMTEAERNAFLSDLHVGVIAIDHPDEPPLAVPIWYDYSPEVGVRLTSGDNSLKTRLLTAARRFSLVVQDETPPCYRYVSVEGPVVVQRPADVEADLRTIARRYLGVEGGDAFTEMIASDPITLFIMRPEKWRTVDYGKSEMANLP